MCSGYRLELEPQKRNVFVTQLREDDEDDGKDIRKFPIVKETSGKLLEMGLKTRQSTLLLKKEVEVKKVQDDIEIKRRQFSQRMEKCQVKENELKAKQKQIRDRVGRFEKFIQENDAKKRRAIQKYQSELKLKEFKIAEARVVADELDSLKSKKRALQLKVNRYSLYEKYLMKVLEHLPEDYLEMGDSLLMGLMMRFRTLNSTNQTLVQMLSDRADQLKKTQQLLQDMNLEHTQTLLLKNSELAALQEKLENCFEKNAKLDQKFIDQKATFRQQSKTLGCIKLAISNIAEKCPHHHAIPLGNEDFDAKLKAIEKHVVEYEEICRLAKPPESATVSTASVINSSPSILKKESRYSKLNTCRLSTFQPRASKNSSSGLRTKQMSLRFAADVK